jgi:hypothetical protein
MKYFIPLIIIQSFFSSVLTNEIYPRRLRDHEQKVQKYEHWEKVKDLPLGEKEKDAYTRKQDYLRRQHQQDERLERWEKGILRYDSREPVAEHHLKVELANKDKQLYERREMRKRIRGRFTFIYIAYVIQFHMHIHLYI